MRINKIFHNPTCKSGIATLSLAMTWCLVLFTSCTQPKKLQVKANDSNAMVPIEIIKHDGSEFDSKWLNGICEVYKIKPEDIREWGNRVLILARASSLNNGEFLYWLNNRCHYPQDSIVVFDKPFYTFNR